MSSKEQSAEERKADADARKAAAEQEKADKAAEADARKPVDAHLILQPGPGGRYQSQPDVAPDDQMMVALSANDAARLQNPEAIKVQVHGAKAPKADEPDADEEG